MDSNLFTNKTVFVNPKIKKINEWQNSTFKKTQGLYKWTINLKEVFCLRYHQSQYSCNYKKKPEQ